MKPLFNIEKVILRIFYFLITFLFSTLSVIYSSANSINYEQVYRSYFSSDLKNIEETNLPTNQNLKDAVTVWQFTCKSERDLVDYRNLGIGIEAVATKTGGQTIGLGLDADLALHRGTGAITYKGAGWQQAGLTKVDWEGHQWIISILNNRSRKQQGMQGL